MKSINKTARLAGFLYLMMAPFAIFSIMYVPTIIISSGDATITANNIIAFEGLFRSGIVSWLISQTIFVFLVLVLYKLLKTVNKGHALFMVVLALVAVPIAFINELNQFAALKLLSGANYLDAFEVNQLHAQVMFFLDLHAHGIYIAHVFWGLWLFPLAYLVFKSGFIPKIIGVLLMIGSFGYLIDFVIFALYPNLDVTISQFTGLGELILPLWLLIKGINVVQWEKHSI